MRTAFLWVITQRVVVIPYRRFRTTYRSHCGDWFFESESIGRGKSKSRFRKLKNSSSFTRSFLQKVQRALLPDTEASNTSYGFWWSNPATARPKASVCGRSLPGNAGPNPTGVMGVCLSWALCIARYRSLRRADHSSRGFLPSMVCPVSMTANPVILVVPGTAVPSAFTTVQAIVLPVDSGFFILWWEIRFVSNKWNSLPVNVSKKIPSKKYSLHVQGRADICLISRNFGCWKKFTNWLWLGCW